MAESRMGDSSSSVPARSMFVTGLAWSVIVLAGLTTVVAIVQNVMVNLILPAGEFERAIRESEAAGPPLPLVTRLIMEHIRIFFLSFLVFASATLVASIGLLRRLNWARLLLLGLLLAGVAWNVAGAAMMAGDALLFLPTPAAAPPEFREPLETFTPVIRIVSVGVAVMVAVLFGWIAKRLTSPETDLEFRQSP
jgi:hypothetical protein